MRILVTGGTGFVGRHLVAGLAGAHEVIAPARRELDLEAIDAAGLPRTIDAVIHAAARIDPGPSMRRVNVESTRALCRWAADSGARRFLFVSTGGVYGPARGAVTEEHARQPSGEYAETKAEAEDIVAAHRCDFEVILARIYFPYGPGQRGRFIPNLAARIAAGEPVTLRGASGTPLSVTYIDDLVEALLALFALEGSHTVNVAGEDSSVGEIATMLGQILKRQPQFAFEDEDSGGYVADCSRLRELTGFHPSVSLRDGLPRSMA